MKYNENADTLLFVLLFTTGQREKKNLKKHYLWVQAIEKGEKQRVLEVLYRNIYQILKVNFQQNFIFTKSIFVLCLTDRKAKTISLKVFKITKFKNLHQETTKGTLRP